MQSDNAIKVFVKSVLLYFLNAFAAAKLIKFKINVKNFR